MYSEDDLRSFITLALRHSCKVRRVSSMQVESVIRQLGACATDETIVRAILGVACPSRQNVVDIRRPLLMRKVAKLLSEDPPA